MHPNSLKPLSCLLVSILFGMFGGDVHAGWVTSSEALLSPQSNQFLEDGVGSSSISVDLDDQHNTPEQQDLSWLLQATPDSHPAHQQTSSSSSSVNLHGPSSASAITFTLDVLSQTPLTVRAAFESRILLPRYLVTGIFRPPRFV